MLVMRCITWVRGTDVALVRTLRRVSSATIGHIVTSLSVVQAYTVHVSTALFATGQTKRRRPTTTTD